MIFAHFLQPNCYNQIHLIPSKLTALQCGVIEGFMFATLFSVVIGIIAFCMSVHYPNIRNYFLVSVLVSYVACIGFFGIGYVNLWTKYQQLITTYRSQGMSDFEIYNLILIEQNNSSNKK